MTPILTLLLLLSGFVVGFLNTLAGGASVISMTLFLALDMPILEAIATNRLAIFLQNLASTLTFRRKRLLDVRTAIYYAIPVAVGTFVGAQISFMISDRVIERLFMLSLLVVSVLLVIKPESWLRGRTVVSQRMNLPQILLLYTAGLYGGSIYVGLGYILLSILVLSMGYDLIRANAIKGFMAFVTTPFALILFALHGEINYLYGLVHALGNIVGALVAAHYAQRIGTHTIRYILMALIILSLLVASDLIDTSAFKGALLTP